MTIRAPGRPRRALARHALAVSLLPAAALAQEAPSEAALAEASALYERGVEAHRRGDRCGAAVHLGEADLRVPDAAALEAALGAALGCDDPTVAMPIAARADGRALSERAASLAHQIRARHGPRAGRIVIRCERCEARIDGVPAAADVERWVLVGDHEVAVTAGGLETRRDVRVEPGAVVTLMQLDPPPAAPPAPPPAPPPPSPPPPDEPAGLSPAWFWIGLATTAAVGAAALASAVDTANKHDAFDAAPSQALAADGMAAETRTNVLFGVTAGLGATVALVGLLAVDWDR
jgi:hypothetical protein